MQCIICGRPREATHHWLFGIGIRPLADEDEIYSPICNCCHNMAAHTVEQIHGNDIAEKLSKIIGQLIWEQKYISEQMPFADGLAEEARERFKARYGKSWL